MARWPLGPIGRFSDAFEEQGIFNTPFYGGYGLIAWRGIPKAACHLYRLLHLLGDQRLYAESDSAIITKRKDGSLAIALWNYAEPGASGPEKTVTLDLRNRKAQSALLHRVDAAHHSTLEEWTRMGRPESPTPDQMSKLQLVGAALAPESISLKNGRAENRIPGSGFALIEIGGRSCS